MRSSSLTRGGAIVADTLVTPSRREAARLSLTEAVGDAAGDVAGAPVKGLQGLVLDAIGKCDVDVRKELYGGVLLTGGVSLIPNLRERLERELSEQVSAARRGH
eukprot:1178351-Prorocentrum_minimum.AAC.3